MHQTGGRVGDRCERQSRRRDSGQILQAMHRDVGTSIEDRPLHLAREDPLPPHVGETAALFPISHG